MLLSKFTDNLGTSVHPSWLAEDWSSSPLCLPYITVEPRTSPQCRSAFLLSPDVPDLDFQCGDDVSESKQTFRDWKELHAMQVQDDIMEQLKIPSAVKLVSSFNRPNIHYSVKVITEAQSEPLPQIVALLKEGRRAEPDGAWPCSIIYALKKESTEEIAAGLTHKGSVSL